MRKSIVVLIVAVLAVAAGAVVLSLSAPVLDEEVEYRLTSLYSRGGLPAHSFRDMVEVNVVGGEEALHVVLSMEDGLFAVYQDPDWSYAIREGEALAAAVEALLPA